MVINQAFIQTSKLAKLRRNTHFRKIVILFKFFFQFDEKFCLSFTQDILRP